MWSGVIIGVIFPFCTVVQYAMPSDLPPKQSSTSAPSTSSDTAKPKPSEPETAPPQKDKEPPKKKKDEQTKNKKEGKQGNNKGGGGGAKGGDKPVDVSRLDMRIGKILKAWKHPDADGLYVEEGMRNGPDCLSCLLFYYGVLCFS